MGNEKYKTCHILVSGIVQGVGYRYYTLRKAGALGLTGFVRNLPDGRVEVEVEGEESAIQEFIGFLRKGPIGAHVYDVQVDCYEYRNRYIDFRIRY